MKASKQLYHEHKIITLILTSPIWLFVLFSVLFTANEIYKSTQEGVVTEVLNKTLPHFSSAYLLKLLPVSIICFDDWIIWQDSLPDQLVPGNRIVQGFLLFFF